MFDCMAERTADSFGISLMPVSPNGRNMCAIDVQINMATPPRIPARRIFISRKADREERNLEGQNKEIRPIFVGASAWQLARMESRGRAQLSMTLPSSESTSTRLARLAQTTNARTKVKRRNFHRRSSGRQHLDSLP